MNDKNILPIPLKWIGPIKILSEEFNGEVEVPLATLESPLWASVNRGAKIAHLAGGIKVAVVHENMTRSVLLEARDAMTVIKISQALQQQSLELKKIVASTSKFAELEDWQSQIVGSLWFLRFAFKTKDAAGHNMATKAADALVDWIIHRYPQLKYVSISANYCVDKKVSAVNGILGRGRYAIAELVVPSALCQKYLRTTPAQIVELNTKKNLVGSILAGSIMSANAHFANILLAFYLATGQDAANIVEGSQGITYAELHDDGLYFSVTIPNLILGTVGSGKSSDFAKHNLQRLGCLQESNQSNARKLAIIAAATVLCGELSLLAALTNRGELTRAHLIMERRICKLV